MPVTKVYRYGLRTPDNERLALQVLGQASFYREACRRAANEDKARRRADYAAHAETAHVEAWAAEYRAVHVLARDHHLRMVALKDLRLAGERTARGGRGHLIDAGTYWLVEEAVAKASKDKGLSDIERQHYDGTGRIGAWIAASDKFAADDWRHPRVSLTTPNERGHAILTMRIGLARSATGMQSIMWPIMLHRPLPAGARVDRVAVQRTLKHGHRYRWEALITVTYEPCVRDEEATGTVGLDIGWRRSSEGQRVAVAVGDDGEVYELHTDVHEAHEYADAVRGFRDRTFDMAKAYVAANKAEAGAHESDRPADWKSKARLHDLAITRRNLGLLMWRERDRHLEDIECGARTRAQRRRLDAYRVFADRLARRYRTIAMEDMQIQEFVGEAETHAKERRRSTAGLYLLQQCLIQRFGVERIDWVPPEYTTRTCADCGHVRAEAVGPALEWTCESCGVVHDQDENAANVIRQISERRRAAGNAVRALKDPLVCFLQSACSGFHLRAARVRAAA